MSSLKIESTEADGLTFVRLEGVIDEDARLSPVGPAAGSRALVVNAAGIARINSVGVRDWVDWLEPLSEELPVYLVECSPAVIFHANFVSNFLGKAHLVSFYAPYYCTDCDHEAALLVDARAMVKGNNFGAPSCACNQCTAPMEFDDADESYFSFLKTLDLGTPGEEVLGAIGGRSRKAGEVVIRSAVADLPKSAVTPSLGGLSFDSARGLSSSSTGTGSHSLDAPQLTIEPPTPSSDIMRAGEHGRSRLRLEYLLIALLLATVVLVAIALFKQT